MKKILALGAISFLLFGIPAFAGDVDLSGCWAVEIEGISSKGDHLIENNHIWINQDEDYLFWGWVCNFQKEAPFDPINAEEGMHFSGAVDGKDIYITHWDSFTKVRINGPGNQFSGINQAVDIDNRDGRTSFGIASKVDEDDCDPCRDLPYVPSSPP